MLVLPSYVNIRPAMLVLCQSSEVSRVLSYTRKPNLTSSESLMAMEQGNNSSSGSGTLLHTSGVHPPSGGGSSGGGGSRKERHFWQYNVQAKGPKGQRVNLEPGVSDPHQLVTVADPVFASTACALQGIKHRCGWAGVEGCDGYQALLCRLY